MVTRNRWAIVASAVVVAAAGLYGLVLPPSAAGDPTSVGVWTTDPGGSARLAQSSITLNSGTSSEPLTITVDPSTTYQSVVGFGASLTDSSAWVIHNHLNQSQQDALMTSLFSPSSGIGISMLRQPMGASDFTASGFYTYDDMPVGQTDPGLTHFSIAHDESYILPQLRQALAIAPDLTVMATPWSPPAWMRNGVSTLGQLGGALQSQYYSDWAQYFVKFIQAYAAAGVPVSYITPQNEPLNALVLLPSMGVSDTDEAMLIGSYLGPALQQAGLSTKILGYDYTWDNGYYPTTLLNDPTASQYIDGTAWHCYGGDPSQMTPIHDLAPSKGTFETECSGLFSSPPEFVVTDASQFKKTMNLFINSTRNWARSVLLWNVALDPLNGPSSGCVICRPLVSMSFNLFSGWSWSPQIEYYAMGQVAKFIRPGAVRVSSTSSTAGINDVAFVNTDGSKVIVALNDGSSAQTFAVQWGTKWFSYTLNAGAAATFTLPAS
jgi:glucosylceramidase